MSNQDATGRPGGGDSPRGPGSTGCRSHKPEWDRARDAAEAWTGLEGGLDHRRLLDDLEDVQERFNLKPRHIRYLRASFKKLRFHDFEPGDCPPSVWMKKRKLAKKARVSLRTVLNIEKDLARAGFLYWTDTASRRREGKRSKRNGRIKWAHGVTFAPFAAMAREIGDAKRLAEEEEIESEGLVHEIATIRCHSRIPLQAALRLDETTTPVLRPLLARVLALPDAKGMGGFDIDSLRSLAVEARHIKEQVRALTEPSLDRVELPVVDEVETPEPASLEHKEDAEICTLGRPPAAGSNSITDQFREIDNLVAADPPAEPSSEPPAARPSPERGTSSPSGLGRSPVSGGPPAWLILDSLSPRLGRFLPPGQPPTTDECIQAANRTRSELGISPEAWRDACTALSPAWAFMAVVIVASRDDVGEIHTSAGGYFRKLTQRARKGTLNLAGSLWGVIERSEQLHVARVAPATEGEPSIPGPDPGFQSVPLRVGGQRADQRIMAALCRTAADPQALLLAWRELVARYRCWPYRDEVERLYEQLLAPRTTVHAGRNSRRRAARDPSLTMPDFSNGLPNDTDPREVIRLLRCPGVAARAGLHGDPEGPVRLLEYWIDSVDEKEWQAGGRPISTVTPQQAMADLGLSEAEFFDYARRLRKIGAFVPVEIRIDEEIKVPGTPPSAVSPAVLDDLPPAQVRGPDRMPPSIRDALALFEKIEAMTEAERDALAPTDIDHWLAALAVSRMSVPLARFMPPVGRLDCMAVITATKQALPEFRISPRAWKAFCRRHNEFNAVIAVCIVVHEILDHPGPVPEDLPDKILRQLTTHDGSTAFFRSRDFKRQLP